MNNFSMTLMLLSNKNCELSYKLNDFCKTNKINIIYVFNYFDLTFKVMNIKPNIIIYDTSTINIDSKMLDYIKDSDVYKNISNIVLQSIDVISNVSNDFYLYANMDTLLKVIQDEFVKIQLLHSSHNLSILTTSNIDTISNYLKKLGLSPKHIGFFYIREIIIETYKCYDGIVPVLSECYAIISTKHKTTLMNIERCIRHAIGYAWDTHGNNTWKSEFGVVQDNYKKPCIRDFISCTMEQINSMLMKNNCYRASYI